MRVRQTDRLTSQRERQGEGHREMKRGRSRGRGREKHLESLPSKMRTPPYLSKRV